MLNKRLVTAVNEAHLVMTNQKGLNYEDYRCPRCSKRMMLVISQQKMPFFKQLNKIHNMMGEKEEHHHSKMMLKSALTAAGFNAQVEIPLADGQIRADVLASPKLAFEVQCAPLSTEEFNHRHALYQQVGITDIWIVGQRHYLKDKIKTTQLIFMRENQSWRQYFLEIDPTQDQFRLKFNILQEPVTRKLHYQIASFDLDDLGIQKFWNFKPNFNVYHVNPNLQREYLQTQIKQKSKLGLEIAKKLYQKHLSLESLPNAPFEKWRKPGDIDSVSQYLD